VNLASLLSGKKSQAVRSAETVKPATADPEQVTNFETQQSLEAKRDGAERARQQQIADQLRELQAEQQAISAGPEAESVPPMTPAQRTAIYGDGHPIAPKRVSDVSEAQAEAKQRALAREKQHQDALTTDTVAIDFARTPEAQPVNEALSSNSEVGANRTSPKLAGEAAGDVPAPGDHEVEQSHAPQQKNAAIRRYDFDSYDGKLYRIFEGTVLESVVTNHIDGGFTGPILIMLTTDYYSHDHQQLLLPQGTRLIGTVQSVGSGQQRKLFVAFHRAICPDGFSVDLEQFSGLDPLGTTGVATKVNHGYLTAFAAAAAIGGLGGLAQVGNGGIGVIGGDPSVMIRNGITAQAGQEAEQILNHFLNRLPVITLKEGARARVYIGRDILLPAYADHRVAPNL
jgi:type IV secretion system protein VirB10